MKQITLIRHVKVEINNNEKIDSSSLKNWGVTVLKLEDMKD
jgi:hypothetical protein